MRTHSGHDGLFDMLANGADDSAGLDVLAVAQPLAVTPDSWKSAVSSTWANGADWSTGAAPTGSNAVSISVAGTYQVVIAGAAAAYSVAMNDAGADLIDSSSLDVGSVAVTAGTFTVAGGAILAGGTIATGTAGSIVLQAGATLLAVTYCGPLTLGTNASINVEEFLTVTGANGTGNGTISLGNSAEIWVQDTETLNNATLTFKGPDARLISNYTGGTATPGTLTLGSGFTILQSANVNYLTDDDYASGSSTVGDGIVNDGLILVSGGMLVIDGFGYGTFANGGSITVSGGKLQLNAVSFSNAGSVAVSGTGTLDLLSESLIVGPGGNAGSLTTSGSGEVLLDQGSSLSGTINASTLNVQFNSIIPYYGGGQLVGVTWEGPLTVSTGQIVNVSNGLTLTGAGGSGAGTLNIGGTGSAVIIEDNETLDNATLNFTGNDDYLYVYEGSSGSTQTVTLGSGFTVSQATGNNYIVGYQQNPGVLINAGLISVSGGELRINDSLTEFINSGDIALSAGILQFNGVELDNAGSITVSGTGTLDLQAESLIVGPGGNAGSLTTSGNGEVLLDQGSSLSGTINASTLNVQFNSIIPYYSGGQLVGVTWEGPLTVGANQVVNVSNGLTLTGADGSGAGTLNIAGKYGAVIIEDNETLDNATLNFGGNDDGLDVYEGSSGVTQTVTLGSGFTVLQTTGTDYLDGYQQNPGVLINAGLISVSGGGLNINYSLTEFSNTGTIAVSAGILELNGVGFANTGSITVSGTGTLFLESENLVVGPGGNTGSLTTSGNGEVLLYQGSSLSGTIDASMLNVQFSSIIPYYNGGQLVGVTWEGPLTVGANQVVNVSNGLTLTGADGSGAGTLNIAGQYGAVIIEDNETLDNATLNFGGVYDELYVYEGSSGTTQTVTLGSGFTVLQTTGTDYLGGYQLNPGVLINDGLIDVSGGELNINDSLTEFSNTGTIAVSAGILELNGVGFANTGSITVSGTGTLFLESENLVVGPGGNTGSLTTSGNGEVLLYQGSSLSGTIDASMLNVQFSSIIPYYNGGQLVGVTWEEPLTVGANQVVNVSNGLTLTGADGSGAGTLNIAGQYGAVIIEDNETLDNATLNFGGYVDELYVYEGSSGVTQTVTLGSGFTVLQSTGTDYLGGYQENPGVLINAGLIDASGGTLDVDELTTFDNSGTIDVSGGTLAISLTANFANAGTIDLSNGGFLDASRATKFGSLSAGTLSGNYSLGAASVFELANNLSITTLAGTVTLTGAGSSIQSTNTNSGGQITLDNKLVSVADGGILSLGAGRSFTATNAFTDSGMVSLAGGAFTEKSLTVAATGYFYGSGSVTGTLVDNGNIVASGGTLTLLNAVSGTGVLAAFFGATLDLTAGEPLTPELYGEGTIQLDGGAYSFSAANVSVGTIAVDSTASLSGSGTLAGGLTNNGTVSVTSGALVVDGPVTGDGTFQISSGATLDIAGGGSFAGAIDGNGGSLYIDDGAPFVLQAGASFGNEYIVVDAGATLELTQGGNLNGDIVGAGTLQLDGASAYSFNAANGFDPEFGTLLVDTGASLNASGTLAQNLEVLGALSVTTGTLFVNGVLIGTGTVGIGAGALLDLSGANAALGTYALTTAISGAGTLELGLASSFAGGTLSVGSLIVGASLAAAGTIAGAVTVDGTLEADASLAVTDGVSGFGTLLADAGAVLDISGGGTLSGTVSGAGTLQVDGAAPLVLASGSTLGVSATVIDAGATLDLYANETLPANIGGAGTLALDGNFTLGTKPAVATLLIDAGASLSGVGTLNSVIDNGALLTKRGTLAVTGGFAGNGTLSLAPGSVLDLRAGGSFGGSASGAGTLLIDGSTPLTLGGASLHTALSVHGGASLSGYGTITGAISDGGAITAAGGRLILAGPLSGTGNLAASAGATLALSGGGMLALGISGAGTLQLTGAYTLGARAPSTASLVLTAGSSLSGAGKLNASVTDNGTLLATGGTLTLARGISGGGTLSVSAGSTLSLGAAGSFSGAVTGAGEVDIAANLSLGGAASLSAADIVLSANLVQAGGDSVNILAGNMLTLSAAAGHVVSVQGAGTDRLSNAGSLAAAGAGSAKVSEAFVNTALVTSSAATLSFLGAATNDGIVTAASGLTEFSALLGGNGALQIGAEGTLSLLAGALGGQTVDFLASTGALDLTKPASFLGTISGFGGSDAIELVKTKETSFSFSHGALTVMDGKATVATLDFAGSYTTSDFALGSDGHGGTAVTFI